jgi:hypothetical protein
LSSYPIEGDEDVTHDDVDDDNGSDDRVDPSATIFFYTSEDDDDSEEEVVEEEAGVDPFSTDPFTKGRCRYNENTRACPPSRRQSTI